VTDEPLGLLVLDKSKGPTSHDAVAAVRRAIGLRRVGHAGTLDPWATGVLLVGVGRATRLLRFLQGTDKAYEGTLVLGVTTDTLDAGGVVTGTYDMSGVGSADVDAAAASLTGDLAQVPPMVSALHHEGRRLHELAREGIEVERAPRAVRIDRFEVDVLGDGTCKFAVTCSAGTYVRSLVDELGRALGGGAHVATLRRTRVGRFTLDDAVALEGLDAAIANQAMRSPLEMVEHLGTFAVGAEEAHALRNGRFVQTEPAAAERHVAMVDDHSALIGVGVVGTDGVLRPDVVMTQGGASRDG
jgi:tRNA pseudouridine55 synthase